MTEHLEWKWYSGSNEEQFSGGPFDTREEAIADLDGYGGYIVLARKVPLRLSGYFDVDTFLEQAEEAAYDLCNESGDTLFDLSKEQSEDLQARIRTAIEAWQYAHNLTFVPWAFTGSKNLERIPEDEK